MDVTARAALRHAVRYDHDRDHAQRLPGRGPPVAAHPAAECFPLIAPCRARPTSGRAAAECRSPSAKTCYSTAGTARLRANGQACRSVGDCAGRQRPGRLGGGDELESPATPHGREPAGAGRGEAGEPGRKAAAGGRRRRTGRRDGRAGRRRPGPAGKAERRGCAKLTQFSGRCANWRIMISAAL